MRRGHQLSVVRTTGTQRIAMTFDMLVIVLEENAVSFDELAKRKACFGTLQ